MIPIRRHYICHYCLHVYLRKEHQGCKTDLPGNHPTPTKCLHTGITCKWEEDTPHYTGDGL